MRRAKHTSYVRWRLAIANRIEYAFKKYGRNENSVANAPLQMQLGNLCHVQTQQGSTSPTRANTLADATLQINNVQSMLTKVVADMAPTTNLENPANAETLRPNQLPVGLQRNPHRPNNVNAVYPTIANQT